MTEANFSDISVAMVRAGEMPVFASASEGRTINLNIVIVRCICRAIEFQLNGEIMSAERAKKITAEYLKDTYLEKYNISLIEAEELVDRLILVMEDPV